MLTYDDRIFYIAFHTHTSWVWLRPLFVSRFEYWSNFGGCLKRYFRELKRLFNTLSRVKRANAHSRSSALLNSLYVNSWRAFFGCAVCSNNVIFTVRHNYTTQNYVVGIILRYTVASTYRSLRKEHRAFPIFVYTPLELQKEFEFFVLVRPIFLSYNWLKIIIVYTNLARRAALTFALDLFFFCLNGPAEEDSRRTCIKSA